MTAPVAAERRRMQESLGNAAHLQQGLLFHGVPSFILVSPAPGLEPAGTVCDAGKWVPSFNAPSEKARKKRTGRRREAVEG